MRAHGWKVPTVLVAAGLAAACGREAESATDRDSQRLVPAVEAEATPATEPAGSAAVGEAAAVEATRPAVDAPATPAQSRPEAQPTQPPLVRTDTDPSIAPAGPTTMRPEETTPPPPLAVLAGTQVVLTVEDELSTKVTRKGDAFDAVVAEDVLGASGVVLLPRGARVRGVVTESTVSPDSNTPAVLALGVERVEVGDRLLPLNATVTELQHETEARDSDTRTATKVGAGAVAGALLGKVIGGDGEDALKGAVAGAAAGAVVAHATRAGHAKVPQGARMVIVLDQDLVVERGPGTRQ